MGSLAEKLNARLENRKAHEENARLERVHEDFDRLSRRLCGIAKKLQIQNLREQYKEALEKSGHDIADGRMDKIMAVLGVMHTPVEISEPKAFEILEWHLEKINETINILELLTHRDAHLKYLSKHQLLALTSDKTGGRNIDPKSILQEVIFFKETMLNDVVINGYQGRKTNIPLDLSAVRQIDLIAKFSETENGWLARFLT